MTARFLSLLLACSTCLLSSALANDPRPPGATAEVLRKRAVLGEVIAELSLRDVSGLTPAQVEMRARCLDLLRGYSERGEFPLNREFPDMSMPYFVDDAGARCAVAHLMEASGHEDLMWRLARTANNSFAAELLTDRDLLDWVTTSGFTVDEIAYIQDPPGGHDDWGQNPVDTKPVVPEITHPVGGAKAEALGGGSTTSTSPARPRTRPNFGSRARTASSADATWEAWWALNREAFVSIRDRYHQGIVATSSGLRKALADQELDARPMRPRAEQVERDILPTLRNLATASDDLAAMSLMAMARSVSASAAPAVVKLIADYMGEAQHNYRDYLILALGVLQHESAIPHLRAVLLDDSAGRKLLKQSPISERTRAFAALALGRCGDEQTVEDLWSVLREEGTLLDLKSACVSGLGLLAKSPALRMKIVPRLVEALDRGDWPATVLAHIPVALAKIRDSSLVAPLVDYVRKFAGSREVRRSCALSLGLLGEGLDPELVKELMAAARRDPDPAARQFAIMALGEMSYRDSSASEAKVVADLAQFYADGVSGFFNQPADVPWYALSAGLFAHAHPAQTAAVVENLTKVVQGAASVEDRAAAALALGLAGEPSAAVTLEPLIETTATPKVRAFAAEGLGILGDQSAKDALTKMCLAEPVEDTRYHAAMGLAYLGNASVLVTLVNALQLSPSQSVQAALTRAIGEIGDKRAIAALTTIATDGRRDDISRSRAVAALGMIGQASDHAWVTEFKRGYNFTVTTPAMNVVLTNY